jgi:rubrerythrin
MMVMITCNDCGWLWVGDPDEELCPHCYSDDFDWSEPDPEDYPQ